MLDEHYITDTLKIEKDILKYNTGKEFVPIKKYNWHKILSEYGWSKINKNWIVSLNKLSIKKEKNSLYGIYDVPRDGNCFYHCIAKAFTDNYVNGIFLYDDIDIRKIISNGLTQSHFENYIEYYRIIDSIDENENLWDPTKITSLDDLKKIIESSTIDFWVDFHILQFSIEILNINILILNTNEDKKEYSVYNTMLNYDKNKKTIFLSYENENHFNLVGHYNGNNMITLFEHEQIPIEFTVLFSII